MKHRKKKCRQCREWYVPRTTLDRACSPGCALKLVRADREKAEKKEIKRAKEKLKTRRDHLKEAQQVFNAFIRERDRGKPCISCGKAMSDDGLITGSRIDAGHYLSTGSHPELRFDESNCHAQCVKCNRHMSGNAGEYRLRLIERVGLAEVDRLEGPHEPARYTVDDLVRIKAHYRARSRELRGRMAQCDDER